MISYFHIILGVELRASGLAKKKRKEKNLYLISHLADISVIFTYVTLIQMLKFCLVDFFFLDPLFVHNRLSFRNAQSIIAEMTSKEIQLTLPVCLPV